MIRRKTESAIPGVATTADRGQILAIIERAFVDDPPARWLFPEDAVYRRVFPAFADAFGGAGIGAGTATLVPGRAAGLWLAPGVEADEERLVRVVLEAIAPSRQDAAMGVFAALGEAHPQQPHWYCPLIGVIPAFQGQGLGGALLRHALERCDADGLPAYLEATSVRSVALYERFGFRLRGEIAVADCPTIYPMWREVGGA